jgi:hypothetical protein
MQAGAQQDEHQQKRPQRKKPAYLAASFGLSASSQFSDV